MNINEVGERIREIRGEASMEEFAAEIGTHRNTLGNYERGTREVSASVLAALYELGWNPSWILTGDGPPIWADGATEVRNSYQTQLVGRASAATIAGLQDAGMPAHEPERWHFFRSGQAPAESREAFQVVDYIAMRIDYMRQLGVMPAHALLLLQGDDALTPALRRGDLMIVDSSDTEPPRGSHPLLYCVCPNASAHPLAARYVQQDGSWNKPQSRRSPDVDAPLDKAYSTDVSIIGRVSWHARIIAR